MHNGPRRRSLHPLYAWSMATEPPNQTPLPPPPPPGPGAPRSEWHDYRHQMRDFVRGQRRSREWYGQPGGGLFLAVALVIVGAYFLLRNLGAISWLRDDIFWPSVLIVVGLLLLLRRGNRWR